MVCEVQHGNGLFKYNKEMVCVSTSRRCFVKYKKEMICEVTAISWCCEVQQGDDL